MGSRYNTTEEQELRDIDYKRVYFEKFDKGRKQFIKKIATLNIDYPTFDIVSSIEYENYVWALGDRYYKLSAAFYGDPTYWWVIAWFNKKPTESHLKVGDVIRVPKSLGSILSAIGY